MKEEVLQKGMGFPPQKKKLYKKKMVTSKGEKQEVPPCNFLITNTCQMQNYHQLD